MHDKTDNALVRSILEDGTITDAEIEDFMSSYNECLSQYNLSVTYDRENSSESLVDQFSQYTPAQTTERDEKCKNSTGYYELIPLDEQMHSNPTNLSNDERFRRIYDCRKRHNLMDDALTFEEYRQLFDQQTVPSAEDPLAKGPLAKYYGDADDNDPAVQQWYACSTNPDS